MNAVGTLELGTKSNSSPQSNDRWLLFLLAGLDDCVVDSNEVTTNPLAWGPRCLILNVLIPIIHMEDLPIVGQESSLNILSESESGVPVDRDV